MIGVDLDAQKLSLGLKPSYFEGEDGDGEGADVDADQTMKDLDEEAFEAAAELDSSDEDMELGEYCQQKGLSCLEMLAHAANGSQEGRISAQRACLGLSCIIRREIPAVAPW